MPENFQTSFIPKTPFAPLPDRVVVDDIHRGPGFLGILAYFLLFISVAVSGGILWYRTSISQAIDRDLLLLEKAETTLDQTLLQEVRNLDNRIAISQRIMDRHYSVAYVLDMLGKETTPSVQFESFRFGQEEGNYVMQLDGFAKNYTAIAEQSRSFSETAYFKDHLFSGIALDDMKEQVRFKLEIVVPLAEISFKKVIGERAPMVVPATPIITPTEPMLPVVDGPVPPANQTQTGIDQIREIFEGNSGVSTTPVGPTAPMSTPTTTVPQN
ncbi:MAG TPA: hypothetical protein VGE63_00320 [Candidatus Paceibacterota bacterium]